MYTYYRVQNPELILFPPLSQPQDGASWKHLLPSEWRQPSHNLANTPYWHGLYYVVAVEHLKPVPFDVFGRQLPPAGPVRVQNHERRIIHHNKERKANPYLIGYVGLRLEHHEWL